MELKLLLAMIKLVPFKDIRAAKDKANRWDDRYVIVRNILKAISDIRESTRTVTLAKSKSKYWIERKWKELNKSAYSGQLCKEFDGTTVFLDYRRFKVSVHSKFSDHGVIDDNNFTEVYTDRFGTIYKAHVLVKYNTRDFKWATMFVFLPAPQFRNKGEYYTACNTLRGAKTKLKQTVMQRFASKLEGSI